MEIFTDFLKREKITAGLLFRTFLKNSAYSVLERFLIYEKTKGTSGLQSSGPERTREEDQAEEIKKRAAELKRNPVIEEVLRAPDIAQIDEENANTLRGLRTDIRRALDPKERQKIETTLQKYEREKESQKVLKVLNPDASSADADTKTLLKTPAQKVWEYIQQDFKAGKDKKRKRRLEQNYIEFLQKNFKEVSTRGQIEKLLSFGNLTPEFVAKLTEGKVLGQERQIASELLAVISRANAETADQVPRAIGSEIQGLSSALDAKLKLEVEQAQKVADNPALLQKKADFLQKLTVLGPEVLQRATALLNNEAEQSQEAQARNASELTALIHSEWQRRISAAAREGASAAREVIAEAKAFFLGNGGPEEQGLIDFFHFSSEAKETYLRGREHLFANFEKYVQMAETFETEAEFFPHAFEILEQEAYQLDPNILSQWKFAIKRLHADAENQKREAAEFGPMLSEFASDLESIAQESREMKEWPNITPKECQLQNPQLSEQLRSFFAKYSISEERQIGIWQYLRGERNGEQYFPFESIGAAVEWGERWHIRDGRTLAAALQNPHSISGLDPIYIEEVIAEMIPGALSWKTSTQKLSAVEDFHFNATNFAENVFAATPGDLNSSPQERLLRIALQDGMSTEALKLLVDLQQSRPSIPLENLKGRLEERIQVANEQRNGMHAALDERAQHLERLRTALSAENSGQNQELIRSIEMQLDVIRRLQEHLPVQNLDEVIATLRKLLKEGNSQTEVSAFLDEALLSAQHKEGTIARAIQELQIKNNDLASFGRAPRTIDSAAEAVLSPEETKKLEELLIPAQNSEIGSALHRKKEQIQIAEAEVEKAAQIPQLFAELKRAFELSTHQPDVNTQLLVKNAFEKLTALEFNGIPLVSPFAEYHPLVSSTGFFFDNTSYPPRILIDKEIYNRLLQGQPEKPDHIRGVLHEMGHLFADNSDQVARFTAALKQKGIWNEFCQRTEAIYREKLEQRKGLIFGEKYKKLNADDRAEEFLVSYLTGSDYQDLPGFAELRAMIEANFNSEELEAILALDSDGFARSLTAKVLPQNFWARLWKKQGRKGEGGHGAEHHADDHHEHGPENHGHVEDHGGDDHHGHDAAHDYASHGSEHTFDHARKQQIQEQFLAEKHQIQDKLENLSKIPGQVPKLFVPEAQEILEKMETEIATAPEGEAVEKLWEEMQQIIKNLNTEVKNAATKLSSELQVDRNFFLRLKDNTILLSLKDVAASYEIIKHEVEHMSERNRDGRSGAAVQTVALKIYPNGAGAGGQKAKNAERTAVSKHQENLAELDPHELMHEMPHIGNKDEFKAAMRVLASKGAINWRNPEIWRALNRFGARVNFLASDADDPAILAGKLQDAFSQLYDREEYQQLERDNLSNYESRKSQFDKEADQLQGFLVPQIQSMIANYRKDKSSISPQRYEIFVERLIKDGKGDPTMAIYYLMLGIYEGILTPERGTYFDKGYLNYYPITQMLDAAKPTIHDYKRWIEGNGFAEDHGHGAHMPIKVPLAFREWIQYHGQTVSEVVERTEKTISQGTEIDHDYLHFVAAIGSKSQAQNLCRAPNGKSIYPSTGMQNALSGMLEYAVVISNNEGKISKERLRETLARQASYFSTTDAILDGKLNYGKDFYRFSKNELQDGRYPRDRGILDNVRNTQHFMELHRQIVSVAAPEFFKALYAPAMEKGPNGEKQRFDQLLAILQERHKDFIATELKGNLPSNLEGMHDIIQGLVHYQLQNDFVLQRMLAEAKKVGREQSSTYTEEKAHAHAGHGHGGHGHDHAHAA